MQFIALDVIGALLGAAAALVLGAVLVYAWRLVRRDPARTRVAASCRRRPRTAT